MKNRPLKKYTIVGRCACGCFDDDGVVLWVTDTSTKWAEFNAIQNFEGDLIILAVFSGHIKEVN